MGIRRIANLAREHSSYPSVRRNIGMGNRAGAPKLRTATLGISTPPGHGRQLDDLHGTWPSRVSARVADGAVAAQASPTTMIVLITLIAGGARPAEQIAECIVERPYRHIRP
jgi:hypothetical protein